MKKVLILWLWGQWIKYVKYFLKNNYEVIWVCNTSKTKIKIEKNFKIKVLLEYKNIDFNDFELIIIALPIDIQAQVALEIAKKTHINILVEIPVSFDNSKLLELTKYDNIKFYLEEYFTKLSTFLQKIELNELTKIQIELYVSHEDKNNKDALKVAYVHVLNNFLLSDFDLNIIDIKLKFHNSENINYKINFIYKNTIIKYCFLDEKYLQIWDKKISDDYNFDFVLKNILQTNISQLLYLKNFNYINKII